MKNVIVFVSFFSLIFQVGCIDRDFPYVCHFEENNIVHLEYSCYKAGKSQRSICLNSQNLYPGEVTIVSYWCNKNLNSMKLHLNELNRFTNMRLLDTSNLGINTIEPIWIPRTRISENFEPNSFKWQAVHNQFTQIPIEFLNVISKIYEVDFSSNHIMELNFKNLKTTNYISSVKCSENKINSIERVGLSTLHSLQILELNDNNISWIDEDAFSDNKNMEELHLRNNPLKKFNFNVFSMEAKWVKVNFPSRIIEELDISCVNSICHFNNFYEYKHHDFFYKVQVFNASRNHRNISELLGILESGDVKILDLSWNSIEKLDNYTLSMPGFSKLKHLNLSHTMLTTIEKHAFISQKELISLDLSGNYLKSMNNIEFGFGLTLKNLNLMGNELNNVDSFIPSNLLGLQTLRISTIYFESSYLEAFLKKWKNYEVKIDVDTGLSTSNSTSTWNWSVILMTGVMFGVIIILVVLVVLFHFRQKKLKKSGLINFEMGDMDSFKPNLTLDEQADLLPYVKKYEFPRKNLKLGKQLGAGAFGIVLEATAQGIIAHEEETKVAVKMLKNIASNEVMRASVLELKIMAHLGRHLNVVNLLGAITKDITKFDLMIIVEYCRFGNLQSFLLKNRRHFVDQIAPDTGEIDLKIAPENTPNNYEFSSSNCNDESYDGISLKNLAVIKGESTEAPTRSVTTKDLLIWSFQIARGMDYLASRKVLHGDLAARNILLCDDNVVKICDFGLARSLYKNENYHMKTKRGVPWRWLALESLNDLVFNTCTDVWSFGIVLWELFSLGATPYPDFKFDELKLKLNDGYRLEIPEYATQDVYDIMLSCWCYNPEKRPKFNELEKGISKILGKTESKHYIDLNEPYLEANECRFKSGEIDYLALLGTPDSQAPSVPVCAL